MAVKGATKGRLKQAIADATASAKKRASGLSKRLKESTDRRTMEAIEVVAGGVLSGAVHGADISLDLGETEVPIGAAAGIIGVVAGTVMKQPDVQAVSLGAATYGLGRLVEDVVADAFDDTGPAA